MSWMLRFVVGFAVAGLVISVAAGILGGNRIVPLIVTAVVSALVSGALGGGVCKVLEQRVPEFFDLFRQAETEGAGEYDPDDFELGDEGVDESDLDEDQAAAAAAAEQGDTRQFGDHIIVDKIKIKNEPKLMAEAIKTMLAKDKD